MYTKQVSVEENIYFSKDLLEDIIASMESTKFGSATSKAKWINEQLKPVLVNITECIDKCNAIL